MFWGVPRAPQLLGCLPFPEGGGFGGRMWGFGVFLRGGLNLGEFSTGLPPGGASLGVPYLGAQPRDSPGGTPLLPPRSRYPGGTPPLLGPPYTPGGTRPPYRMPQRGPPFWTASFWGSPLPDTPQGTPIPYALGGGTPPNSRVLHTPWEGPPQHLSPSSGYPKVGGNPTFGLPHLGDPTHGSPPVQIPQRGPPILAPHTLKWGTPTFGVPHSR